MTLRQRSVRTLLHFISEGEAAKRKSEFLHIFETQNTIEWQPAAF